MDGTVSLSSALSDLPASPFEHDLVLAIVRDRLRISGALHRLASIQTLSHALAGSVRISHNVKEFCYPPIHSTFEEKMGSPSSRPRRIEGWTKKIKNEFGHVALIVRRHGQPRELFGKAIVVGFYPYFLSRENDNGTMRFREPLSDWERTEKTMRYHDRWRGSLCDDAEISPACYATLRLSKEGYERAPREILRFERGAFYHAFGIRAPNCVTCAFDVANRLGATVPSEIRHYRLPCDISDVIRRLAQQENFSENVRYFVRPLKEKSPSIFARIRFKKLFADKNLMHSSFNLSRR